MGCRVALVLLAGANPGPGVVAALVVTVSAPSLVHVRVVYVATCAVDTILLRVNCGRNHGRMRITMKKIQLKNRKKNL